MKKRKTAETTQRFLMGIGFTAKGSGALNGIGILSLEKLKKAKGLGAHVENSDLNGTKTQVFFFTLESVNDLISDLINMRKKMKSYYKELKASTKRGGITIDVSKIKPLANSNVERKVSRKRKK